MIGNAHLDPAWMWQWGEGMEAFIATCRSALDRMNESPGFIFTCSSAAHYRWVEEVEPALFESIRARVAERRWVIVGGWWTQADCNLPSGEGFARQALLGQRYFLSRFGRRALTGYSPDAFGHTAGLPQLLGLAGMNGYIFCRPDPTELALPSPLFDWIAPDGSSVLAYRVPFHYNMYESSVPKKVADLLAALDGPSSLVGDGRPLHLFGAEWGLFYGVGNHGGGPTREHIAQIIAIDEDPEAPALPFSDPDTFLERMRQSSAEIPVWHGELQMNSPGCYSAHSAIKKLNRSAEHLLMVAERISSIATLAHGAPYPLDDLRHAWENVCFNHFHDILCGVAIREALEDAIGMYGESLTIARRATRHALQRIARGIDSTGEGQTLMVMNTHAWPVAEHLTVELWHDIDKALWSRPVDIRLTDDAGNEVAVQTGFTSGKIGRDRIAFTFRADLPPLGWRCYRIFYGERSTVGAAPDMPEENVLENDYLRIEISSTSGAIGSMIMKESSQELVASDAALPVVIADPTDTWGHGRERFDDLIGRFGQAEVRRVAHGPVHSTIRSRSRWGSSWVQQDFTLHHDSRAIDVDVKIFWAEEHRMLKLAFPVAISDARAEYEGAYSVTGRNCNGVEVPGGSWSVIAGSSDGEPHGVAIVNDAKHGYSAEGSGDSATLAVTLLRSPSYATHDPHPFHPDEDLDFLDQGVQRFRYRIIPFTGAIPRALLAREAALINAPALPHLESPHEHPPGAALPRHYSGIEVTPSSVIATVLKRAEENDGWIIRLFETSGSGTAASVALGLVGAAWHTDLGPHELQTWRIGDDRSVARVDLVELPLS
jgi:alpha-mannosidase